MSENIPIDDLPDETLALDDDRRSARAPRPTSPTATTPGDDLSAEIALAVERRPGEQVTCRRVGQRHYRCNWWTLQNTANYDNPLMRGDLVTTSRIARSEYLHVTRAGRHLAIRVDTRTAPRRGPWFAS